MRKFVACFASLTATFAFAGDEKVETKTVIAEVAKPSKVRIVTTPVQVLKQEVVTKTSTAPATLIVEERRGLFGKWKPKSSTVVIQEKK